MERPDRLVHQYYRGPGVIRAAQVTCNANTWGIIGVSFKYTTWTENICGRTEGANIMLLQPVLTGEGRGHHICTSREDIPA